VLAPIVADTVRALDRFARKRGIGLVLDRAKLDAAIVVVLPGTDLTDAFLAEYNRTAPAP
jgi:hypothetical protein